MLLGPSTLAFETGSLIRLECLKLQWLTSEHRESPYSSFPSWAYENLTACQFLKSMGSRESNLGSHACIENSLLTGLVPQFVILSNLKLTIPLFSVTSAATQNKLPNLLPKSA